MKIQCAVCKRLIDIDVDRFLRIGGKMFHNKQCNIRFNSEPVDVRVSEKQTHHLTWRDRN